MQIEFLGATREVTGSKFLITTKGGKRILLDCGMYQGKGLETDELNRNVGFDPKEIDFLILSHAHIDHSGLVPYIYKLGFRGSIISTSATRSLCQYMLIDSAFIQESDTSRYNKNVYRPPRRYTPKKMHENVWDCLLPANSIISFISTTISLSASTPQDICLEQPVHIWR